MGWGEGKTLPCPVNRETQRTDWKERKTETAARGGQRGDYPLGIAIRPRWPDDSAASAKVCGVSGPRFVIVRRIAVNICPASAPRSYVLPSIPLGRRCQAGAIVNSPTLVLRCRRHSQHGSFATLATVQYAGGTQLDAIHPAPSVMEQLPNQTNFGKPKRPQSNSTGLSTRNGQESVRQMTFSSQRASGACPRITQVLARFRKFQVKRSPKWRLNAAILADDVISSAAPAAPDFSTPRLACGISHSCLLNSRCTSFWGTHPECRAAMRENAHGIRTKRREGEEMQAWRGFLRYLVYFPASLCQLRNSGATPA